MRKMSAKDRQYLRQLKAEYGRYFSRNPEKALRISAQETALLRNLPSPIKFQRTFVVEVAGYDEATGAATAWLIPESDLV